MVRFVVCAAAATLSGAALAADRCVLVEQFTATWCSFCPPVESVLSGMQDAHPQTMAYIQIHSDDAYEIPWSVIRHDFYGVQGYPTVWMDGVTSLVGQLAESQYTSAYATRAATTTDVTVQSWAVQVNSSTWTFTSRVRVESSGQTHNVKIRLVQVLDDYPSGTNTRNCVMQASAPTLTTLAPGQSIDVSATLTLDSASLADLSNVRLVTIAQDTGTVPSGSLVYQSKIAYWPLPSGPSATPGDTDLDGDVDIVDLSTLLQHFGSTTAVWADGDFDGDADVDLVDLSALFTNYGT